MLLELDVEMEHAAASLGAGSFTIFRRIVLPNLLPAISAGTALPFARAISEFGATVLIAGNLPVASVHIYTQIETDNTVGAAAVATVLLLIALIVLVGLELLHRWARAPCISIALRLVGVGYLTLLIGVPVALIFWRTFEHGLGPVLDSLTDSSVLHAFRVTAIVAFWAVLLNTVFGVGAAILLVRHRFRGRTAVERAHRSADRGLAGRRRPRADPGVRQVRSARRLAERPRDQDHLRLPGNGAGNDVRIASARRPRSRAGARRDRHRAGAGGVDPGRRTVCRRSAG